MREQCIVFFYLQPCIGNWGSQWRLDEYECAIFRNGLEKHGLH